MSSGGSASALHTAAHARRRPREGDNATAPGTRRRVDARHAGLASILVLVVAILGLNGLDLAYRTFAAGAGAPAIGRGIATSFGSVTVAGIDILPGLTAEEVGGMTHGVSGFVAAAQEQIGVNVLVANSTDHAVRILPAAFTLAIEGTQQPFVNTGATFGSVLLQPGSSVEGAVKFIVPRAAANVFIHYLAPDGAAITVPAGRLDVGPAPSDGGHH